MFELGEGGEGQQRRLTLPSLVRGHRLLELQHGHKFAAASTGAVDILQPPRHGFVHHIQDTGFGGDTCHGHMLLAGANTGLHDGILPVGHRLHLDEPALVAGRAGVAGKFRHGVAGVAVLILLDPDAGDYLSLDNILGVRNAVLLYGKAGGQFHRLPPEGTGNRQLVEAQRCRGGLEAGGNLNGWIHADADGNGKTLSQLLRPLGHGADMPGTGSKKDGQLVPALEAQPVDGHVGNAGVWMAGVTHTQRDVGPRVIRGVGRGRNQPAQIKVRILCPVDYLLAKRCAPRIEYRLHRVVDTVPQ